MRDETNASEESIEALGGVLPDGRTVDLIKDDATGRLKLLCFDGAKYHAEERVSIKHRTFVPPSLDPALRNAITLPTKASDYGSTKDLFHTIVKVLTEYGMSAKSAKTISYFAFSNWSSEPSSPALCLVVTGPNAEAGQLIQLLACVVRRGLPMAEIDSHRFRTLIPIIHPTVLIDTRHFTSRSLYKLSASCGTRVFAPCKRSVAEFCFAKVLYVGATLVADVHFDCSLRVNLSPSRRGVPLLDERKRGRLCAALQSKLLGYRLRNLSRIRASDFDLPDLDIEGRTIGRLLGRCIVDAPQIQGGVRSLLEDRDDELRTARWTDAICVIIEALLDACHRPQPNGIYVGEVAKAAAVILKARGASDQLEARGVGDILTNLGFTAKRKTKGYQILVTDGVIRMIHAVARDYRVAAVEHGIARCSVCRETFTIPDATDRGTNVHGGQSA